MLTGREQETAFLENHYKRTGSQILVVYGQRGVGKTALLTSFTEKKQTLRYSAGNCSSREQQYLWGRELRSRGKEIAEYPSWRELLECMTIQKGETTADKKVLIIENFQYLLKGDTLFLQELIRFLKEKKRSTVSDPDHLCLRLGGEQHDFQSGKSGIFRQRISEGEGTAFFRHA